MSAREPTQQRTHCPAATVNTQTLETELTVHGSVTLQLLEFAARWTLVSSDDPIELMAFDLDEGCRMLVKVEGVDAAAEHLAKRLYGILTARYSCENLTGSSDNSK